MMLAERCGRRISPNASHRVRGLQASEPARGMIVRETPPPMLLGWLVLAPPAGMLKRMTSGPPRRLGVALASRMAWRMLPEPLSAVLVTVKTAVGLTGLPVMVTVATLL